MRDVSEFLRSTLAELLATTPGALSDSVQFRDQGLDSARALRWTQRIAERVGYPIPVTTLWQFSTLNALAKHLTAALSQSAAQPPAQAAPAVATPVNEPIAIVGIGCRLPGGIDSATELWRQLASGVDAVSEVPGDRWDGAAWFDGDPRAPGKASTRWGGFIRDVTRFDAAFFSISPAEARQMDPQQRIALETTWAALEDARLVPARLAGARGGVFFGAMWQEYGRIVGADATQIEPHSAMGWDNSIVPARISYLLGMHGPLMTVNTACSSSLVSVHLGVQSLRRGECELVIAGGVSLMLGPHASVQMSKFGAMSPDGRCRAFDARANGYVRGEGCGVVILRRLSDALASGDRIYAVIKGSALSSDGASNGLSAPNPEAQAQAIRIAWQEADVPLGQVAYVETHGTGTPLGDPIEASGLASAFSAERREPLLIGSAKTNFGHLEAAAGITGLIKTALALHNQELPPSLHFETPNPHIDFERAKLKVVTSRQSWPADEARHAGVSSFGFGGTNAHVALGDLRPRRRWLAGARAPDTQALAAQLRSLADDLRGDDAAATLAARLGRSAGTAPLLGAQARAIVTGADAAELARATEVALASVPLASGASARAAGAPQQRTGAVFVFPGQGGQWDQMGVALLEQSVVFAAAVSACDAALKPWTGWSVLDVLRAAGEPAVPRARVDVVQATLFAMGVGLAAVWRSLGVEPTAVVGHSQGEVVAAVVCGALSIEDGARIAAIRGLTVRRCSGQGAMALIERGHAEIEARLTEFGGALSIAAINSPSSTVVSGDALALDTLTARLESEGWFCRRVNVDYASHSAQMDSVLPDLAKQLAGVNGRATEIPFYSTVTGGRIDGRRLSTDYWCQNLRRTVRLDAAIQAALADGRNAFIEVSPHPVLAMALAATCRDSKAVVVGSLQRDSGGLAQLQASLSQLREFERTADERETGPTAAVRVVSSVRPRLAFFFSGHSGGWLSAARGLLFDEPRFWEHLRACDEVIGGVTGTSILGALAADEARAPLAREDVADAVLLGVLVAVARTLGDWGIEPDLCLGQGVGGIAAAVVGGRLTLREAAELGRERGRLRSDRAERSERSDEDGWKAASGSEPLRIVEVGARAATDRALETFLGKSRAVAISACWRSGAARAGLEVLAGELWCEGFDVDLAAVNGAARPPLEGGVPLVLSGKTEDALRANARRLAEHLAGRDDAAIVDVAWTLATARTHFDVRCAPVARSREDAVRVLGALAAGASDNAASIGRAAPRKKVVFVFPGQGAQWDGMARALLAESSEFAAAVRACDAALRPWTGWSVLDLLLGTAPPELSTVRADVVQPALFAMAIGLAAVWKTLGLTPSAVVGHSQGEVAAAVVCGALSLEEGARVVAVRSQAVCRCSNAGGMVLVERPLSELEARLAPYRHALSIGAVNTGTSAVVSGERQALEAFMNEVQNDGWFCRRVNIDYASHSPQMDLILPQLGADLADCRGRTGDVPFYSTVTGALLEGTALDGEYWCRNLRRPVRFDRALDNLLADDHDVFVEVSPHPVLALPLTAACAGPKGVVTGSLKRDAGGLAQLYAVLGQLHVSGYEVDWQRALRPFGGRRVDLPTYAFQGRHYWGAPTAPGAGAVGAGLQRVEHPLLGAFTALAETDTFVVTGRLALADQPWLRDHVVFDRVVFPGAAIVELILSAAHAIGFESIAELVITAPLIVPESGALRLQIRVGAPARDGRPVALYCQPEGGGEIAEWVRHASGTLAGARRTEPLPAPAGSPAGGSIDLGDLYDRLADLGLQYGPMFRGLRALSVEGSTRRARVALSETSRGAAGYGIHPALLDAALHPILVDAEGGALASEVLLPFVWSDVTLHGPAGHDLQLLANVAEARDGSRTASIQVTDDAGAPVLTIGSLQMRRATREQVGARAPASGSHLYRLESEPVSLEAPRAARELVIGASGSRIARSLGVPTVSGLAELTAQLGAGGPVRVVVDATRADPAVPVAAAARAATEEATRLLQAWSSEAAFTSVELVFVTRGAMAAGEVARADDAIEDLAQAPLWGLVRAARAEAPERELRLVDADDTAASLALLPSAIRQQRDGELVLRDGRARAPRLRRVTDAGATERLALDPDGAVLVSGGSGEIARSLARHLVGKYGARHLVLASRRGLAAAGTRELDEELRALGARSVRIAECDVSERSAVAALLDAIAAERRLIAVFHLAGVLEDGLLASQTPEKIGRSFAPKVDGALHLHELTRGQEMAAFVLFSSVTGLFGGAGQSNYAAANTFLDALAAHRRAHGLAGTSLAWGLWQQQGGGMTAHLGQPAIARLRRAGLVPMDEAEALALLDAALARPEAVLAPVHLDLGQLREAGARLAPILHGLIAPRRASRAAPVGRSSPSTSTGAGAPALAKIPDLRELVRGEAAVVLGLAPNEVPEDGVLKDLGLDSLMALELRNRLMARTQTALGPTAAFDYPTPRLLAARLMELMDPDGRAAAGPARAAPAKDPREPIAIVSMACRLPGGLRTPEEYWALLSRGGDAVSRFPGRWDAFDVYDPDPAAIGKSYTNEGGFLTDVDQFDARFFEISPREAHAMDPQQRVMLETAWEALERAGMRPSDMEGRPVGVYLGAMGSDYGRWQGGSLAGLDGHQITGSLGSVISGRVSYALGLQGPSMTIDTACSSSLVALHLAASALRQGECDVALAGGVTIMSTPERFVEFSRLRGLARDGRCKSFSADADGVSWSEGCAVLVLKRLSVAQRAGDRVLAVIRGAAVNQDGRSQGLTAPNGPAQQRVIREALQTSGLAPGDIDAVEAHGTGTTLGDPIEAAALAAVFGSDRPKDHPLRLGSAKSNLAHAQAAAGVAGVIKMVLALENETLPPTIHAENPSPHVEWEQSGLALLRASHPWPRGGRIRRAGVSSFGISGTNAHLILEEAPAPASAAAATDVRPSNGVERSLLPLVLSGRDEAAVRAQSERWGRWLEEHGDEPWPDVVRTAALERAAFECRVAVVADGAGEAARALRAFAEGRHSPSVVACKQATGGKLATLFSGQGSQRVGMGLALRDAHPVFRDAFAEVSAALRPHLGQSIETVIADGDAAAAEAALDSTLWAQPALFALEVALFRQWQDWGLRPAMLAGHSLGEISAAHVAGILSLDDAARLVSARARLMNDCRPGGSMVTIEATESEVQDRLDGARGSVDLAAVNGPQQVVISGDAEAVQAIAARFEKEGRRTRRLRVSHAFHSRDMDAMLPAFAEVVRTCAFQPPQIELVSFLAGERASEDALRSADYWVEQVRRPVLFHRAVQQMQAAGATAFLECGPDRVLTTLTRACVAEESDALLVASLRKDEDERRALMMAVAQLHSHGHPIDWRSLLGDRPRRVVGLPTYPFTRRRYWWDPPKRPRDGERAVGSSPHPLLGRRFVPSVSSLGQFWDGRLSAESPSYLADHGFGGDCVLPAAATVEMILAAGKAVYGEQPLRIEQLAFLRPLVLSKDVPRRVQLVVHDLGAAHASVQVSDADGALEADETSWQALATGQIRRRAVDAPPARPLSMLQERCAGPVDPEAFYARTRRQGVDYGASFRCIDRLSVGDGQVLAHIRLPEALSNEHQPYQIHPALLDAATHASIAALPESADAAGAFVPVSLEGVELFARPGGDAWSHVRLRPDDHPGGRTFIADVEILTGDGRVAIAIEGMKVAQVADFAGARLPEITVEWQPAAAPPATDAPAGNWLMIDRGAEGAALQEALERRGAAVTRIGFENGSDRQAALRGAVDGSAFDRVVYIGGRREPDLAIEALELECADVLEVVRALAGRGKGPTPRLWLVTRLAQPIGKRPVDPAAAMLWGLGRTIAYEHPELRCSCVDLAADEVAELTDALVAELLGDWGETEISLAPDGRRVARLARAPRGRPAEGGPAIRSDAGYLITGGLGGLGLAAARWLVGRGARHLVLVGRAGAATGAQRDAVAALEREGAQVTIERADVADPAQVARVMALFGDRLPPLRGIIHCAGVIDDALLSAQTSDRLRRVLAPKAIGAWNLHRHSVDRKVDFFVSYSSVASVLGSPGQGNYAAANAFLDGLAHHRIAVGLPAISVGWGAFSGDGMLANDEDRARLAARGMGSIDIARSGPLLSRLLAAGHPQVAIADVDIDRWLQPYPDVARAGRFSRLVGAGAGVGGAPQPSDLPARLAAAGRAERVPMIEELLSTQVAKALRLESARPAAGESLKSLGVDSLMAIELRNAVHAALGVQLAVSAFLQDTTIGRLAQELLGEWTAKNLVRAIRVGSDAGEASQDWETTSI